MPVFKFKRGTQADTDNYIGEPGEITVISDDNYRPVVHDGVTSGGYPLAFESELGSGGTVIIDDFESGGISNYGGDTSEVSVQTSTVYEGTYALANDTGSTASITSTSGLNAYPSQGDTFTWRTIIDSGFAGGLFAVQSEAGDSSLSGYLVHAGSDTINIQRNDSGTYTKLNETTGLTIPTSAWVQFEVTWLSDGSIDVVLYDDAGSEITTLSATDTTYTSGGVGWRTDNANQYQDYMVIQ